MKLKKQLLGVVLMFLLICAGISVEAKTVEKYKVYPLVQKTWSKAIDSSTWTYSSESDTEIYTYNMSSITIPADGYVYFTFSNSSEDRIVLYPDKKRENDDDSISIYSKKYTPLPKGTYYVNTYKTVKYKYTYTKAVNNANYCSAKASSLTARSKVFVCNTPHYSYNRWYKVKTTTKQRIRLYTYQDGEYDSNAHIYSAKRKSFELAKDGNRIYTQKTLPAGIYYICIEYSEYDPMTVFYWY